MRESCYLLEKPWGGGQQSPAICSDWKEEHPNTVQIVATAFVHWTTPATRWEEENYE